MKKPRIFLSLTEVANFYNYLQCGLQELGYSADKGFIRPHPFYAFEINNPLQKFVYVCVKYMLRFRGRPLAIVPMFPVAACAMALFFIQSLFRYNVFVFAYARSFLPYQLDLPLLRALGKKVIFVFHGSDSRPPYIDGGFQDIPIDRLLTMARKKNKEVRRINRYANYVVDHPTNCHFHTKPFISSLMTGLPIHETADIKEIKSTAPKRPLGAPIRILHAPSKPRIKGSPLIREAVSALQTDGYKIDYVEITGQPNKVVLQEIQQCDFVIDQIYSDAPFAGLATEAAYFKKPAIVGGYEFAKLREMVPDECFPPSFLVLPDVEFVKAMIKKLIDEPAFLSAKGEEAHQFVTHQWSYLAVAERFAAIFSDEVPKEWLYDPAHTPFVYGHGMNEETLHQRLHALIAKYGQDALCLNDKPAVKKRFVDFVKNLSAR